MVGSYDRSVTAHSKELLQVGLSRMSRPQNAGRAIQSIRCVKVELFLTVKQINRIKNGGLSPQGQTNRTTTR
jgi:hypothetical protein